MPPSPATMGIVMRRTLFMRLEWTSLRPRRGIRLEVLAFVGLLFAALLVEPWWTLSAICVGYLLLLPYSLLRYARFKRRS